MAKRLIEHADEDLKEKLRREEITITMAYNQLKGAGAKRKEQDRKVLSQEEPSPGSSDLLYVCRGLLVPDDLAPGG